MTPQGFDLAGFFFALRIETSYVFVCACKRALTRKYVKFTEYVKQNTSSKIRQTDLVITQSGTSDPLITQSDPLDRLNIRTNAVLRTTK
jgi:hypothetical protein